MVAPAYASLLPSPSVYDEVPTSRLDWRCASRGFWRTADGRFDLFFAEAAGHWTVIDWNAGRRFRAYEMADCVAWCEGRE